MTTVFLDLKKSNVVSSKRLSFAIRERGSSMNVELQHEYAANKPASWLLSIEEVGYFNQE